LFRGRNISWAVVSPPPAPGVTAAAHGSLQLGFMARLLTNGKVFEPRSQNLADAIPPELGRLGRAEFPISVFEHRPARNVGLTGPTLACWMRREHGYQQSAYGMFQFGVILESGSSSLFEQARALLNYRRRPPRYR